MSLEERIELLEFKQELLFDNSPFCRLLFEHNVTREQREAISDIFDDYRQQIEDGKSVHHGKYEQAIYHAIPHQKGNYHFAEDIAQLLHQEKRWEEVFEALYGDSPKFQNYLSKSSKL